jgi:hypothetical protein
VEGARKGCCLPARLAGKDDLAEGRAAERRVLDAHGRAGSEGTCVRGGERDGWGICKSSRGAAAPGARIAPAYVADVDGLRIARTTWFSPAATGRRVHQSRARRRGRAESEYSPSRRGLFQLEVSARLCPPRRPYGVGKSISEGLPRLAGCDRCSARRRRAAFGRTSDAEAFRASV